MADAQIRTGYWINHSRGPYLGATLTLNERDGGLLLSFVAGFVTVTAGQLWSIVCFALHQVFVSQAPVDALHLQRQSVWRNSATPYGAAWAFLLQWWYWRKVGDRVHRRTLPWMVYAIVFAGVFMVVTVFSSQVSGSLGSERLIQGNDCGYFILDANATKIDSQRGLLRKRTLDSHAAVSYARACYGNGTSSLDCDVLPRQALNYTLSEQVDCPFGDQLCRDDLAVQLETQLIDSHHDLGINAPPQDRVQLRQQSICAPLVTQGYRLNASKADSNWEEGVMKVFNYGAIWNDTDGTVISNYTHFYNIYSTMTSMPYFVESFGSSANNTLSAWVPIPALWSADADTSIMFVEINGVMFDEPNSDPIFLADVEETTSNGIIFYSTSQPVRPVACHERIQFCMPDSNCTSWMGRGLQSMSSHTQLPWNAVQTATIERLQMAGMFTTMDQSVATRQGNALRAQETLWKLQQLPLPPNQWIVEVSSWFEDGLALLQHSVQAYAAQPAPGSGLRVSKPWSEPDPTLNQVGRDIRCAMCDTQIVMSARGTLSFSVVGLAVIFIVGGIIILLSLILDPLVNTFRVLFRSGHARRLAWISDGLFNVQQMLLEARGYGAWIDPLSEVPVTVDKEKFPASCTMVGQDALYEVLERPKKYKPDLSEYRESSVVTDEAGPPMYADEKSRAQSWSSSKHLLPPEPYRSPSSASQDEYAGHDMRQGQRYSY